MAAGGITEGLERGRLPFRAGARGRTCGAGSWGEEAAGGTDPGGSAGADGAVGRAAPGAIAAGAEVAGVAWSGAADGFVWAAPGRETPVTGDTISAASRRW